MKKLIYNLGGKIEESPMKTLLIFIVIFAIMIAGAVNVYMATGNATLVDTENDVYKQNYTMEENFGGEAILILFEGERDKLLQVENLEKIWTIEKELAYNEDIFSIMSPASVVNQIATKQSVEIKSQISTMSDGLDEMSSQLIVIGKQLKNKNLTDSGEIGDKLNDLSNISEAFNQLIEGQNYLTQGIVELQGGLSTISLGLVQTSTQLNEMGTKLADNPEIQEQLVQIAENISKSANGLTVIADNTDHLKEGTENTAGGLDEMKTQLSSATTEMSGGMSLEELDNMADGFIAMGENLYKLSQGLKSIQSKNDMMIVDFPKRQEDIDTILYEEDGSIRAMFSDVLLDESSNLMMIKLQGNLADEKKDIVLEQVKRAFNDVEFDDVSYLISGKPVLDSSLRNEMKKNMIVMVVAAVLIMFLVLTLIFKIRWRILSLGIIFIAVIATLGFMGYLSVPMTMVSMAVFPILIGLGIDYSIQFQNRYEEEKSVKDTLSQVGKAVGIAVLATVFGFMSLYSSPVPMIQDFGKMLTIGVIVSFIASIFLLLPILSARDTLESYTIKNNDKKKELDKKPTLIDRVLQKTTKFIAEHKVVILLLTIVLSGAGLFADGKVGVETDIETFMPQNMEALTDIHYVRDVVGSTDQMVIFLTGEDLLNQESVTWMNDTITTIEDRFPEKVTDVKSINDLVSNINDPKDISHDVYLQIISGLPETQRKMFVNDAQTKSVILLNVQHMDTEDLQAFVLDVKNILKDSPMETYLTGKSVLDVEMVKGLTEGRVKMTVLGLALVFLILFIVYRNPFKAFTAIFPISLIVGISGGIMFILGLNYTPITATLGALILGMGTEMTIILLERYLEERKTGKEKLPAMLVSVSKVGRATVASGLTTIGGFSVLMLSKFVILKDFGLMTVINISLALISTFIILPAIILIMDRWLFTKKEKSTNKNLNV